MDAEPERAEEFLGTIPLGRVSDCEQDIGRGVVLVGTDTAYLTGATIPLDGGKGQFWRCSRWPWAERAVDHEVSRFTAARRWSRQELTSWRETAACSRPRLSS